MRELMNRVTGHVVSFFAENRLAPRQILENRSRKRINFLRSIGVHGGIGAEIGVQKGFFSHVLRAHVQPDKLHLIDPWYLLGKRWPWASTHQSTFKALRNILYWFEDDLANGKIVLHVGFDEPVLQAFPDKYFDWVYLDTTHEEEHTRRELEILGRKVKDGGLILGDDWFEDPGHTFHGQLKAIQDFCQIAGAELTYANNIDHQWALRLPAR